jgi:hypothetical protein
MMTKNDANGVRTKATIIDFILCYLYTMRFQGQVEAKRVENAIVVVVVMVRHCRKQRLRKSRDRTKRTESNGWSNKKLQTQYSTSCISNVTKILSYQISNRR